MRWIVAAVLAIVVLVVFREVPIIGALGSLLLAIANLLSALGNLLVRFIPGV